jgi:hypothetical protein
VRIKTQVFIACPLADKAAAGDEQKASPDAISDYFRSSMAECRMAFRRR